MDNNIKVFVQLDENNYVTSVNSSIFLTDLTDWIEIDSGTGDRFAHAQGNYFNKPLVNEEGLHNYKYVAETMTVRETTEDEKAVERYCLEENKVHNVSTEERITAIENALMELIIQ
nr:MAG TPA: hypothetical protein [Caudoviricetes sp.]